MKIRKKKGFTLVELLVVIAIIAMLLAILMPALGKVRQLAQRVMCSTNVGGIGKAMLTYANQDKYESYPVAGLGGSKWDSGSTTGAGHLSWDWRIKDPPGSTNNPDTANPHTSTISACLYLVIKYADASPDQFVCGGGSEKKFDMTAVNTIFVVDSTDAKVGKNVLEFWDFGTTDVQNQSGMIKSGRDPGRGFNSYSYHMPFPYKNSPTTIISTNPITSSSNPAKAIMADRSPFWDYVNASTNKAAGLYGWKSCAVAPDTMPKGNSANHQKEGQNVLFVDQHVKFEKGANCGIELDNIYTTWGYKASEAQITGDACTSRARYKQCGFGALDSGDSTSQGMPGPGNDSTVNYVPQDDEDNYLVNEFN